MSEDFRSETMTLGGRLAHVERAVVSGGFANIKRQRQFRISLSLDEKTTLDLAGSVGDERGYAEMLEIASAVISDEPAP